MSKRTMVEEQIWDCPATKGLKLNVDEGASEYPEKKSNEADNVPSQQGFTNLETASNDSAFESISASSVTPEERVFGIDHLVELICSSMDRKSLLNCRLLNSQWTFFGARALQNMVKIQFTGFFWNASEKGVKPSQSYQSMQFLPELMKASPEFPCTSFSFEIRKSNELLAVSFFNEVGPWIKKLHLTATLDFEDVEKLLFSQLPNLEHFTLKGMHSHSTSERSRNGTRSRFMFVGIHKGLKDGRNVVPKGYFLHEWMSQNAFIQKGKLPPSLAYKLKLKYLEIDCSYDFEFPSDILPEILNYSPHLTQVKFPSFLYHFLMAPNVNRLHLLQTIEIFVSNENAALLDLLATQNEGNLVFLKELSFADSNCVARDDEKDMIFCPGLWSQGQKSISKILVDVSASCEKLTLPRIGFWKHVLIPKMPKLKYFNQKYSSFQVDTQVSHEKTKINLNISNLVTPRVDPYGIMSIPESILIKVNLIN